MSYGLRIINANGQVQIDGTFQNIVFKQKGNVACTTPNPAIGYGGGSGMFYGTVTLSATDNSLIAFKSTVTCLLAKAIRSGANITYTFVTTSATTIQYFLFDSAPIPAATFGLNVWNETGDLVFSSDNKYLKVLQAISGSSSDVDVNGGPGNFQGVTEAVNFTYSYSPGKVLAVAQSTARSRIILVRLSSTPIVIGGIVVGYDTGISNNWSFVKIPDNQTVQIMRATHKHREPLFASGELIRQDRFEYLTIDVTGL